MGQVTNGHYPRTKHKIMSTSNKLAKKIAPVTGGASGSGFAAAERFVDGGLAQI